MNNLEEDSPIERNRRTGDRIMAVGLTCLLAFLASVKLGFWDPPHRPSNIRFKEARTWYAPNDPSYQIITSDHGRQQVERVALGIAESGRERFFYETPKGIFTFDMGLGRYVPAD